MFHTVGSLGLDSTAGEWELGVEHESLTLGERIERTWHFFTAKKNNPLCFGLLHGSMEFCQRGMKRAGLICAIGLSKIHSLRFVQKLA